MDENFRKSTVGQVSEEQCYKPKSLHRNKSAKRNHEGGKISQKKRKGSSAGLKSE
jgi:hypothetical protein